VRVAIYHNLPPGGALRVLKEFVRRTRNVHEYHLYTVDLGSLDGFAYARGRAEQHDLSRSVVRSFRYPLDRACCAIGRQAWLATAPWWMDRAERRIAADINSRGYDLVFVHSCAITHTPSLLRHLDVPSLHFMQEPRRRSFEVGFQRRDRFAPLARTALATGVEHALRRRDRAAAMAADHLACNSYYSAEAIQRAYGRDATVCYLGIDTEVFDLGERSATGPSVISVGALERVKGHHLVVDALALLLPAERPALNVVYERCDAAFRIELEERARSAGVELRLHTGIPDLELARLYRSSIATVAAARLEPFGLVPLESMACGTPVVAVREGGYRESVEDGVNGYLVDRSPAEVAGALARVAAGGLGCSSHDVRRSVLPRWGWDAAVKRQLELLNLAVETHPR
jgi:glycosyltransferase involved in cell wall biosynthesis